MEDHSEQNLVESYLNTYKLEECLDEIINNVVSTRPINPYMAIANAFQSRSFPEIIDIRLNSVLHQGEYGVKASIHTNIGLFTAFVNNERILSEEQSDFSEQKDYSVLDRKLKELLTSVDPTNINMFDEAVSTISELNRAETMALSVACCRAASKYKGKELFEYFADIFGIKSDELIIPLPVVSLCIFSSPTSTFQQVIHLFPIRASSLELAIEKLNTLFHKMRLHEIVTKPIQFSRLGTLCFNSNSLEDLIKLLNSIISEFEESNNLKLSIYFCGDESFRPSENIYSVTNPSKSGNEIVDQLMNLWTEVELISIDQPVAYADIASLRTLKKKIQEAVFAIKTSNNDKMKYCAKGIGGDSGCNLQVPLNSAKLPRNISLSDLEKLLVETPFNIAKFHVQSFQNISQLIEIHRTVSKKLPVYVDCTSYGNHGKTFDDFESDLAVGMGAVQFFGDGIYSSDFTIKLHRLLSIQNDNEKIPFVGSKFRVGFT